MKRFMIVLVVFSLFVAACSVDAESSKIPDSTSSSTTTTVVFEKISLDYPEAKICPFDGSVDIEEMRQLGLALEDLLRDVNEELFLVKAYLGVLYLPGQKHNNKENYFPASFSDFIGCDRAIVVFIVTVLGGVGNADWAVTQERWGRAIYEIATRIKGDERFNEIEQVGIRTIWAADSETMDGIMEMSDIRKVQDGSSAQNYARLLLRDNWMMDIHRRHSKK